MLSVAWNCSGGLHGVIHGMTLHVVPVVDVTLPCLPQSSVLIHVSFGTEVRIQLGTLTHTWNFWRVGHAHTSFDELCRVATQDGHTSSAQRFPHLCQHSALPTFAIFANLVIWNCCFSLCFAADFQHLCTGFVNYGVCFYGVFIPFTHLFLLGSFHCCFVGAPCIFWIAHPFLVSTIRNIFSQLPHLQLGLLPTTKTKLSILTYERRGVTEVKWNGR